MHVILFSKNDLSNVQLLFFVLPITIWVCFLYVLFFYFNFSNSRENKYYVCITTLNQLLSLILPPTFWVPLVKLPLLRAFEKGYRINDNQWVAISSSSYVTRVLKILRKIMDAAFQSLRKLSMYRTSRYAS